MLTIFGFIGGYSFDRCCNTNFAYRFSEPFRKGGAITRPIIHPVLIPWQKLTRARQHRLLCGLKVGLFSYKVFSRRYPAQATFFAMPPQSHLHLLMGFAPRARKASTRIHLCAEAWRTLVRSLLALSTPILSRKQGCTRGVSSFPIIVGDEFIAASLTEWPDMNLVQLANPQGAYIEGMGVGEGLLDVYRLYLEDGTPAVFTGTDLNGLVITSYEGQKVGFAVTIANDAEAWIVADARSRGLSGNEINQLLDFERVANFTLNEIQRNVRRAHFLSRHGAGTTLQQQRDRATQGILPDIGVSTPNDRPSDASRFFTDTLALAAITRAQEVFANTGNRTPIIQFDRKVGEGFLKGDGTTIYTTDQVLVRLSPSGDPITAYPLLRPDHPDVKGFRPWPF